MSWPRHAGVRRSAFGAVEFKDLAHHGIILVTKPGEGVFCYRTGATVELSAKADVGWRFDSWTGNVSDPFSPTTTVTMNESEIVTANFVAVP